MKTNELTAIGFALDSIPAPLDSLTQVADLDYYDGPLISLLVEENTGEIYLSKWCEAGKEHNRWLVFRTTYGQLMQFMRLETSFLDFIKSAPDQMYYLLDVRADEQNRFKIYRENAYQLAFNDLPTAYLPHPESHYEDFLLLDEEEEKVEGFIVDYLIALVSQLKDTFDSKRIHSAIVKHSLNLVKMHDLENPEYKTLYNTRLIYGLGNIYLNMGNITSNINYNIIASELFTSIISTGKDGSNNDIYISSTINLALAFTNLKRYSEAEKILREILEQKPDNYIAKASLAVVYVYLSQPNEAEKLFWETLEGLEKTTGVSSDHYLDTLSNYAVLLASTGRYELAERLFNDALNHIKETLGEQHPLYIKTFENLQVLYKRYYNFGHQDLPQA